MDWPFATRYRWWVYLIAAASIGVATLAVAYPVAAATVTLRPNGDVTAQWGEGGSSDGTCGGPHCSRVDEVVVNTADYIDTPTVLGGNRTELFDLSTADVGQVASQIVIRTHARSGFALPPLDAIDTITPSVWINGSYQAGPMIEPSYPNWQWFTTTFSGSWNQAAIDAARIRYVNTIQGLGLVQNNLQIATSEVVVTYTPHASLNQSIYRVYQPSSTTAPGAALAAQNTAADSSAGSAFRVRMGVGVADTALIPNGYQFKLQYAEKQGVCDSAFAGESYSDVGAAGAIRWSDTLSVSDGAAIGAHAGDPVPAGLLTHQALRESGGYGVSVSTPVGNTALWDMSLASDASTVGKTYCLRIVKNDGSVLENYAGIPEITMTGMLTVDVVDGAGVPVAATVGFDSVNALSQCQATQAITDPYRIRVTNNSVQTNWQASVAPTNGVGSLWQSAGDAYDVNDSNGCSDGGDVDAVAGQLGVSFSSATITPRSGCSANGVATGSGALFSESVGAIAVVSASTTASRFCWWDLQSMSLHQSIPAHQPYGAYSMSLTVTVVAY